MFYRESGSVGQFFRLKKRELETESESTTDSLLDLSFTLVYATSVHRRHAMNAQKYGKDIRGNEAESTVVCVGSVVGSVVA